MKQKKRLIVVASVFFCYVFTILLYKIINTIIICSKIVLFSSKKLFHRFVALMKTKQVFSLRENCPLVVNLENNEMNTEVISKTFLRCN